MQLKVRLVARSARKAPVIAHSIPKPAWIRNLVPSRCMCAVGGVAELARLLDRPDGLGLETDARMSVIISVRMVPHPILWYSWVYSRGIRTIWWYITWNVRTFKLEETSARYRFFWVRLLKKLRVGDTRCFRLLLWRLLHTHHDGTRLLLVKSHYAAPTENIWFIFETEFLLKLAYETRFETVKTVFLKNHVDFHVFAMLYGHNRKNQIKNVNLISSKIDISISSKNMSGMRFYFFFCV